MADLKYYDIIVKPVVTEKTMNVMADKRYTFIVHPDATKIQIREAVEKMFEGVKVEKVNTMHVRGKLRRRNYITGRTAAKKKAIVQLTPGSKEIEIFAGM